MEQATLAEMDVAAVAKAILDAVQSGNWWVVASGVVLVIVWALRTQLVKVWPAASGFLSHPVVSVALPVLIAAAGGIMAAGASGTLTWALVAPILFKALNVGAGAVFAYVGAKKVTEAKKVAAAKADAVKLPQDVVAELGKPVGPLDATTKP